MRLNFMYKTYFALLSCLLASTALANVAPINFVSANGSIATVSPISFSLTQAMIDNTPLNVSYLPPKRLPVNRVPSWLRKNASNKFASFDAFVGLSAVKPELDFFPSLRLSNIRIVDIDIAHAIMPNGEKVVLASANEFFWLNSNNLLVMAGILKRDLGTLWPAHIEQINQNYQRISAAIRQINLQLDDVLMTKEVASIVPKSTKIAPFIASLSSDISTEEDAVAIGLRYLIIDSGKKNSIGVWKIDDFSRFSTGSLINRLEKQLSSLNEALKSG